MKLQLLVKNNGQGRNPHWVRYLVLSLILLLMMFSFGTQMTLAQGGSITLTVREYAFDGIGNTTGEDPIPEFTFLVNLDNSGDPYATDPYDLPSTALDSHSPVIVTGDQTDADAKLSALDGGHRYLITVRADGYKLGGAHFAKNYTNSQGTFNDTSVIVELVKEPLPLAAIQAHVFHDNNSVNAQDDVPLEQGLPDGFHIVIEDGGGEVTVDWFGNPLCTNYVADGNGVIQFDVDGAPIIDAANPGGFCLTDGDGNVTIPNLPRGKYEILAVPPDGSGWIQTSTIEGTKVIDAWIQEGNPGLAPSEFQMPIVSFGFVKEMDNWPDGSAAGVIRGTIKTAVEWLPPLNDPAPLGEAVKRPWIALTDIGGNDNQVYLGRGNQDGSFEITDVPDGTYQMTIWDDPLDFIISFATITIPNNSCVGFGDNTATTVDMNWVPDPANPAACIDRGGYGIPSWYGWMSGTVFLDNNRNRLYEPDQGEVPLNGIELLMRFRDGTLRYGAVTDGNGYYEFPEIFQLGRFYVTEVGFGQLGSSGAYLYDRFAHNPNVDYSAHFPDVLTLANLNWAGKREVIDWGKYLYDLNAHENGGISGIVQYATTRNEFEARLQATEDYEPGIPNVTVNLYQLNPNHALPLNDPAYDPNPKGTFLNSVETDAWTQPSDCHVTDKDGNLLNDQTQPLALGPDCIEAPNLSDEIKDGVFDGGYAFNGLTPGNYVVEVVPPTGYRIVTEEDLNTADGSALVPALPPSGCIGESFQPQVPDDYDSPFDAYYDTGTTPADYKPGRDTLFVNKCDVRAVTLKEGQNKGVDFYLMTDNAVPIPGRLFGVLLDDLNVEPDPTKMYYGEKKGIAHTSLAVRDFTGRLITMVETDEHGIFEVLLPSTYVADCPIPNGVCPALYQVVGNDPGDPGNPSPHYNPNYQSRYFWFDVWPGKTTFPDIALFPISPQQAECELPTDTPQIHRVNRVHAPNNQDQNLNIFGTGFGTTPGEVTLDGVSLSLRATPNPWRNDRIQVFIPAGFEAGPHQLMVKANNGQISHNGLTFHVRGPGYNPPRRIVAPNPNANQYATIQAAINAANDGDLIVVRPGTYYDRFDMTKNVKLQGFGPGSDQLGTGGSVIDLRFVLGTIGPSVAGVAGDENFHPQIDGFLITGSRDDERVSGAIKVDTGVDSLEISNNIIRSNGGGFGGGTTIGEPYRVDLPNGDNDNDNIYIHHNRYLHNGGIQLAGAIGIYTGADNYEIAYNDICGNYSGEYGGGISHYGLSHGGSIHHNNIYFNSSFDEGGGIMIAGELPNAPNTLTAGAGAVDIYNNLIQGNMSNDDGGGIRTLQPLDFPINIYNNMIVNNVATDLGGGISLDDTSQATIINNTIARNDSTATAEDSDGNAHGAGITSEPYSPLFSDRLGIPVGGYPDPVMFNNIICENQAYTYNGVGLVDAGFIDLEVFPNNTAGLLHPSYSLLTGLPAGPDADFNRGCPADLATLFAGPYDNTLDAISFRAEPTFVTIYNLTNVTYPDQLGDYHLIDTSTPANDNGAASVATTGLLAYPDPVFAPSCDFDDEIRGDPDHDIGADEADGVPGTLETCLTPSGPSLGVTLTSGQAGVPAQAAAGNAAVLQYTVKNTGLDADAYTLLATLSAVAPGNVAVDTNGWTVTFDPAPPTDTLNQLETANVQVTVNIPVTDPPIPVGTIVTVEVTAVSQTNPAFSSTAVDTIEIVNLVLPPQAAIYMTFANNSIPPVGSLTENVLDEDIIGFDGIGDYILVFDGSDVGLGGLELDAFDIQTDGTILMSFEAATTLADIGPVDDSDIVQFHPTAYGPDTAGTFSMFLKGADVGLTANGEDIDAITLLEGNMLLISTRGNVRVPADTTAGGPPWVRGADEDLLLYTMQDETNPGAAGTWSLYFDGSDINLDNGGNAEDVNGASIQGEDNLYLTTRGNFWVNNGAFNGRNRDILTCSLPRVTPAGGGTNGGNTTTTCDGGFSTLFTGSGGIRNINGIDVP